LEEEDKGNDSEQELGSQGNDIYSVSEDENTDSKPKPSPLIHPNCKMKLTAAPIMLQGHQVPMKGDGTLAAVIGGNVAKSDGKLEGEGAKVKKISKRVLKTATLMVSTDQIKSGPQT
jgi:hypothetical protein